MAACPGQGVWLSDGPGPEDRRPLAAGLQLLGQELDYLVYDAHAGFDPDGFGAATGALRGGGLLLLLTPPLPRWPHLPDPQARRITVEPYRPDQLGNRFLSRLTRVLATAAELIRVEEGGPIPPPIQEHEKPAQEPAPESTEESARKSPPGEKFAPCPPTDINIYTDNSTESFLEFATGPDTEADSSPDPNRPPPAPDHLCRSADQRQAVTAILRTARGRARRPLVIVADRGRGKTAALGIAAGELLASSSGQRRILVTAPRLSAIDPLFRHAATRLPAPPSTLPETATHLGREGAELRFLAPDVLCQHPEPADLLLVDEAAAIPAPLLETLLLAYPRLVFATTIHGYEGTGRGFEVRFRHALERHTPAYRRIELQTPIRWAPDDPVEALVARALLLDANPAPARGVPLEIGKGRMIREGSRVALLSFGTRLGEVLKAAEALSARGLSPTIADARFAKPLDRELILRLARGHEALITIEEGAVGGFGSHVAQLLADEGVFDRGLKFRSMVLPDTFIDQASPEAMYRVAGMNAPEIEAKVLEVLGVATVGLRA